MGLEDLVPDDKKPSSSTSSTKQKSKQEDDRITIGSEPHKKVFTEDKFNEVKRILTHEMGLVPQEVVNNWSPKERYDVLHEAALATEGETKPEELENYDEARCYICSNALGDFGVEIEGVKVCVSHSVGELEASLNED